MNFKPDWVKVVVGLVVGIVLTYLFSSYGVFGGKGFNFEPLSEFLKLFRYGIVELILVCLFIIVYIIYSLIQKKKKV